MVCIRLYLIFNFVRGRVQKSGLKSSKGEEGGGHGRKGEEGGGRGEVDIEWKAETISSITITFFDIFYRRESTEGGKTCNLESALREDLQ